MTEYFQYLAQSHSTDIITIILLFLFGKALLQLLVNRAKRIVDDGDDNHISQKEQRAETLGNIVLSAGNVFIYAIILFLILDLVGVDIRPILAGAGIIGLAVGFGSQSLVKDIVSGFFILMENQYDIGDKIKIGSFTGIVMKITMRSTVLRNDNNELFYIANGSIKEVVKLP